MATTAAPPNHSEPADPEAGSGPLAAKLARIMGQLDRITRDGQVTGSGGGYSYASADALSDILRPALAAEGVVMLPETSEIVDQRIDEIDKGSYTQTRYTVALKVGWLITDGSTELRLQTHGTGVDYAGKAANAAHTFARVNAFKSAFHLSTGDDPESVQTPSGGGQRSGSQGGGSRSQTFTGELPDVDIADGISGTVGVLGNGMIGIAFRVEDKDGGAFEKIKDAVKGIPGRKWDADAKVWCVPAQQSGIAVLLGRHLGLTIASELVQQHPAESQPAQHDDLAGDPGPERPPADDDSIPF